MKATVNRREFAEALKTAKAVSLQRGKSGYPILQCCRLTADADSLTVEATDLDLWASVKVPAVVATPGVLILPTVKLLDITKGKAETVSIASTETGATVAGADMVTIDPGEYPERPKPIAKAPALIDVAILAELYSQTAYAVTKDESRPAMTGLDLELSKHEAILVATDDHRLSKATAQVEPGVRGKIIIHPRAVATIIRKPAGPVAEVVAVAWDKTRYCLTCGNTQITAKQIEGPYPDWQRVIPDIQPIRVEFDRDTMLDALAACLPFAHPVGNLIDFRFNGTAQLHAETPDVGKMNRELACRTTEKRPITSTVLCECAGLGVVLCPHCQGMGKNPRDPSGEADCWKCEGTGAVECHTCHGSGKDTVTLLDVDGDALTETIAAPDIRIGFNGWYFADMVKRQGPRVRLELSHPQSAAVFTGKRDKMMLMPIRLD